MRLGIEDPSDDEIWCGHRRAQVAAHLKNERIKHADLHDLPAWYIAPIVSVWPIRNETASEHIASWVICGDVPTDTISADIPKTPRAAVRAFAKRWHDAAAQMANAEPTKKISSGKSERAHELALFLEVRARQLIDWANDDSLWDVDDL
jgi:Domain of unknown function (DUF4826)